MNTNSSSTNSEISIHTEEKLSEIDQELADIDSSIAEISNESSSNEYQKANDSYEAIPFEKPDADNAHSSEENPVARRIEEETGKLADTFKEKKRPNLSSN